MRVFSRLVELFLFFLPVLFASVIVAPLALVGALVLAVRLLRRELFGDVRRQFFARLSRLFRGARLFFLWRD